MIADALASANVILGLALAYNAGKYFGMVDGPKWIQFLRIVVGVYWAALYVFVLIAEPGSYNSVLFGQLFVRPAFTITLAVMTAGVIYRCKSTKAK